VKRPKFFPISTPAHHNLQVIFNYSQSSETFHPQKDFHRGFRNGNLYTEGESETTPPGRPVALAYPLRGVPPIPRNPNNRPALSLPSSGLGRRGPDDIHDEARLLSHTPSLRRWHGYCQPGREPSTLALQPTPTSLNLRKQQSKSFREHSMS
jgi:hypothetical protein